MKSFVKRLAAKIMKCGVDRVWVDPASSKTKKVLTRRDVRNLINEGLIKKIPAKKRKKVEEKSFQRHGSRKGTASTRVGDKTHWLHIVKPQRNLLQELREKDGLKQGSYRKLYLMVKGSSFRSRQHLMAYINDNDLMKKGAKNV